MSVLKKVLIFATSNSNAMKRFCMLFVFATLLLGACSRGGVQTAVEPWPDFAKEEVWQLTQIRQQRVRYCEGQQPVTLQLNPEAGSYSGYAGCNNYFGQYEATTHSRKLADKQSEVRGFRFSQPGVTKMHCPVPEMKVEESFLPTLLKVTHYNVDRYSLVFYQNDREVLRFEKQ